MKNEESTTANQTATVAEQGAPVAPEKAPSKKGATQKKGAHKAKKSAQGAKAKVAAPKKQTKAPRTPAQKDAKEERTNKKAAVIAMMKRAKGVTLAEIVEATGWQRHTVRGFVSILGSKGEQKIESSKNAAGERATVSPSSRHRRADPFQRRFRFRPGRRCCFRRPQRLRRLPEMTR